MPGGPQLGGAICLLHPALAVTVGPAPRALWRRALLSPPAQPWRRSSSPPAPRRPRPRALTRRTFAPAPRRALRRTPRAPTHRWTPLSARSPAPTATATRATRAVRPADPAMTVACRVTVRQMSRASVLRALRPTLRRRALRRRAPRPSATPWTGRPLRPGATPVTARVRTPPVGAAILPRSPETPEPHAEGGILSGMPPSALATVRTDAAGRAHRARVALRSRRPETMTR